MLVHTKTIITAHTLPTLTAGLPLLIHGPSPHITIRAKVADNKGFKLLSHLIVGVPTPYLVGGSPCCLGEVTSSMLHPNNENEGAKVIIEKYSYTNGLISFLLNPGKSISSYQS